YSLVRILCTSPNQSNLGQVTFLRCTPRHPVVKTPARISERGTVVSDQTPGPVLTGTALEKRDLEQVVPQAQTQSKIRRDLPVILHKKIELILNRLPDFPVGPVWLVRTEIVLAIVHILRIRWFARFKLLADRVDRTGQRHQKVLSQQLVRRQQSGNPVDAGDRDSSGAASDDRHQTSCGPTLAGGMAKFNTTFKRVSAPRPTQRFGETVQ